jgi:hypothetical protein
MSDTSENKPERLDSDNQINISSLISFHEHTIRKRYNAIWLHLLMLLAKPYVSIRQYASAYVSRCQTSGYVRIRHDTSGYVRIRQDTSAYVRQDTSTYEQSTEASRGAICVQSNTRFSLVVSVPRFSQGNTSLNLRLLMYVCARTSAH